MLLKATADRTCKYLCKNNKKNISIDKIYLYLRPLTIGGNALKADNKHFKLYITMYWTLELAYRLEDAPWPATKEELIDYATRSGAPLEVVENLEELEDDGEIYECIEDIWPDYPTKDDFFFNEEEY